MKSFLSLLLVFSTGIIFYACNKQVAGEKTPAKYVPVDFSKANVGGTHNQSAIRLMDRYEAAAKNKRIPDDPAATYAVLREHSIQQLMATPVRLLEAAGISQDEFVTNMTQLNDDLAAVDWDARNLEMPDSHVKDYFFEITTAIESNSTHQDIVLALDGIKTKAEGELVDAELDQVVALVEVGKASSWMWSDDDGNFTTSTRTGRAMCCMGKRILLADIGSLAGGMIRMGAVGAIFAATPGANGALLGGLAIGAGISSGLAALLKNQAMTPAKRKEWDETIKPL